MTVAPMVAHRVRHGVAWDPEIGYRAMRDWWVEGVQQPRQWTGPWRITEEMADRDDARARAEFWAFAVIIDMAVAPRPNPDIGMWQRGDL